MHPTQPDLLQRRVWLALLAAHGLPGLAWAADGEPELLGFTENVAPLSYVEGDEAVGFSCELLRLMAAEVGLPLRIAVTPWQRAVMEAAAKSHSVLFSLVRLPEREARYRWVGPISRRRLFIYRLTSRTDVRATRFDQLRGLRIGVTRDSAAAIQLAAAGLNLELGLDDPQSLRKLLAGRMDVIVLLDWAAEWQLRQLQLPASTLATVMPLDVDQSYWYGLPADSDPLLARRLQDALDRIRRDGRYERLHQRYLG